MDFDRILIVFCVAAILFYFGSLAYAIYDYSNQKDSCSAKCIPSEIILINGKCFCRTIDGYQEAK